MPHRRTIRHTTKKSEMKQQDQSQPSSTEQRDETNKRRFVDQTGVEARDLPDGGRDTVETDAHREAKRNLPQQHGGELGSDGGIRGDRQMSDADDHGGRKHN